MEKQEKKPKSKLRKAIEWTGTALLGIVFAFVAVCNVAKLLTRNEYGQGTSFGYSSYVVLTNSMEPSYKVKTAIIAYKDDPQKICDMFDEIKDLNLEMDDERNINLTFFDAYKGKHPTGIDSINNQTSPIKAVMTHQMFKYEIDESKTEGQGRYIFFVHGINTESENYKPNQYQVFTEKELLGRVVQNSVVLGDISQFLTSVWGLFICLLLPALYLIISSVIDVYKAVKMKEDEEDLVVDTQDGSTSVNEISEEQYEKLKKEMINEMINGKSKGK